MDAFFYISKARDSNPKGRDRKRDSPVDCRVGSGSSRPRGEAQTGRHERSEMAAKSHALPARETVFIYQSKGCLFAVCVMIWYIISIKTRY